MNALMVRDIRMDYTANKNFLVIARIISVVDAFDAMASTCPYRKGMSIEQALQRIDDGAGT